MSTDSALLAELGQLQEDNEILRQQLNEAIQEKNSVINHCRVRLSDIEKDLKHHKDISDAIESLVEEAISKLKEVFDELGFGQHVSVPTITINSTTSSPSFCRSLSLNNLGDMQSFKSPISGSLHSLNHDSFDHNQFPFTPVSFYAARYDSDVHLTRHKSAVSQQVSTSELAHVQIPTNVDSETEEINKLHVKKAKKKKIKSSKKQDPPPTPKETLMQKAKFFKNRHAAKYGQTGPSTSTSTSTLHSSRTEIPSINKSSSTARSKSGSDNVHVYSYCEES